MTEIPSWELPFLDPYIKKGTKVLEFGDKRNPSGLYRDWYLARGAEYTSVDINARNGVVALDVRKPFDLGKFDVVTNWGFSEHVSIQEPFWANAYNATKAGGYLVGTVPQPNHWKQHAWSYWHPQREFLEEWAHANKLSVVTIEDVGPGDPVKRMWGYVLKKKRHVEHVWGFGHLFWRNRNFDIPNDGTVLFGAP